MFHVEQSGDQDAGMEKRLGRGLGSLLGGASSMAQPGGGTDLPLDQIRPNPYQPRKVFDSSSIEELRDSIKTHGVLQPICVRGGNGRFEIISGERRWRASRLAGLASIPAVVRPDVRDEEMLELALVENIQRQDLDPIEKASGYRELMERLGLSQERVAERVGVKRATVANHLRLLELPERAQEAISAGLISMGHARALAGLKDPKTVMRFLARTVRDDLSVRQLEHLVREKNRALGGVRERIVVPAAPWLQDMERRIRLHLGTRVSIQNGEGYRGQIVLQYHNRSELDRLCEVLAPKELLR